MPPLAPTTDGHQPYLAVIAPLFGVDGVDFAMLHKIYGTGAKASDDHSYSPPVCSAPGSTLRIIAGDPDPDRISTSHVERQNLTMPMGMRRFTGLTKVFSKTVQNLVHVVSLHFMHYNFTVADVDRSTDHYDKMGFEIGHHDETYAFAHRDRDLRIHLTLAEGEATPSKLYLHCEDADDLADEWRKAGLEVDGPQDHDYGKREGSHVESDGNLIRFGSPLRSDQTDPSDSN